MRLKKTVMKVLSTKTHGVLDYLVSLFVMASPWIMGFARGGAETWVLVASGAISLLYSLITDYELGIIHLVSMKTHLILDILSGIFLVISPWIFGFEDYVYLPHVFIGVAELTVVMFSSPTKGKAIPGSIGSKV